MSDLSGYSNPLIVQWNQSSIQIPNEQITVINNTSVLGGIPDPYRKVNLGSGLSEIQEGETLASKQYYVNYSTGLITFSSDITDGTVLTANYYSRGILLMPAKRIWTNTTNPDAVSNIQDMIDNYNNLNGVDLYTKFDPNAGHMHSGKAGDAPQLSANTILIEDNNNEFNSTNVEDTLNEINQKAVINSGNVATNTNYIGDISSLGTKPQALSLTLSQMAKNPKDYGAVGDNVANDITPFTDFVNDMGIGIIPNGSYNLSGSLAGSSTAQIIISDGRSSINNKKIPLLSLTNDSMKILPQNYLFVAQDTKDRNDATTVQIQRNVNTDDKFSNPKAFRAVSTVNVDTTQTEWAVSGEMNNYSNLDSTGNTAISGVSQKFGSGSVFGGHFQAKDFNVYATDTDVTALIGAEINTPAIGLDHPTANQGYGNRYGLHVIAITNKDNDPNATEAEIGTGIMINTDDPSRSNGYFRFGMVIRETANNPNTINTGIIINTSGSYGLGLYGNNIQSHIYSSGDSKYGAIFDGAYTSGTAIRLPSDTYIAFEGTNTIKMKYNSTTHYLEFYNGTTRKGYIDMSGTGTDHAL